ncbi:MAG: class I SAM-dependent methyltransferase [Gallionellaceae bacterium]|nr:class I SAM-dependent methyltransferase [Gallionellaceae bacterium]
MPKKTHWENVYSTKAVEAVGWFQARADVSLEMIQATGLNQDTNIIDVGSGASVLLDDLLQNGYHHITALDLSGAALNVVRQRLGDAANSVQWIESDITQAALPAHHFDVWHDRAVFHFLTEPEQQVAYIKQVLQTVKPSGFVIIATFAEDGPQQCSGLPVMRYSAEQLQTTLGDNFTMLKNQRATHVTPWGAEQPFTFCLFQIKQR